LVQSRGMTATRWWLRLSLSVRFMLAAGVVLICAMTVLAGWVGERVENAAIRVAAEAAAPQLQAAIAPLILDPLFPAAIGPETKAALDAISAGMSAENGVVSVKLWTKDGTLLYGTLGGAGEHFNVDEVMGAAAGELIASFEGLEHGESATERKLALPLIEIYVPVYHPETGQIAAVGEVYQNANALQSEILETQLATWAIVGGTALTILVALWLMVHGGSRTIAAQAKALEAQVRSAEGLAAANQQLLLEADQARLDANRTNEELLARIGADIHDGPVQLLTLLLLTLPEEPDGTPGSQDPIAIGKRAIAELRTISAGLVLPEIESMSVAESLHLAIARHEQMTGTSVLVDFGKLPEILPLAVRTCLYRVVQEGLSNAFRHARGAPAHVTARVTENGIEVVVRDEGPGLDGIGRDGPGSKLGLYAMRNRVAALRGRLDIESVPGKGVTLRVLIPIDTNTGVRS
jgi:signal transduction histidine kinase